MGNRGNKNRKDKARQSAQEVLTRAATAEARARVRATAEATNDQEHLELVRAGLIAQDTELTAEDEFGRTVEVDGRPDEPWEGLEDPAFSSSIDSEEARRLQEAAKAGPPALPKDRWRVAIVQDTKLEFPELYFEVFVSGSRDVEAQFAEMFIRSGCMRAETLESADMCVFTGGPDVDPQLYGEDKHPKTQYSAARDAADIKLWEFCIERGIPMLGICRGAQFLHVMNGGKLYQHVDGHYGSHKIVDVKTKETYIATSTHHQMVIPQNGIEVIATSNEATERWRNPRECNRGSIAEVEAYFYPRTLCLGIQGHPEFRNNEAYTRWTLQLMYDVFWTNPDVDWIDGHRRLLPALLAMRPKIETKGKK